MSPTAALAAEPLPCAIAVMAKASAPGRTKTRLAPPLSLEEAADLNTSFLQDIAENIAHAGRRTPLAAYMAFGPPGSEGFFRERLPADVGLIEVWGLGEFGACLAFALQALLDRGHRAACVLNADSPTLPTAVLVDLAEALAAPGERVVIGPAEDGGYYVLGLKTLYPRLFEDIDWSTQRVFRQTLARAEEIGLPVHLLPAWYDVDDAAGLHRLRQDLFDPTPPAAGQPVPSAAPHTRRLLTAMLEREGVQDRLHAATAGSR